MLFIVNLNIYFCANKVIIPFNSRFAPGVGMMVAGKLEARGRGPNDIRLTLKENRNELFEGGSAPSEDGVTAIPVSSDYSPPVRLVGGRTNNEGRLQVSLHQEWPEPQLS